MYTFEQAKYKIAELVEKFDLNIDYIKKHQTYKEANIEDEYIKPLFSFLNWNTSSQGILNPLQREFIVQVKGEERKAPDYLLQLDGKPCFYIEAKHPNFNLLKELKYCWQAYSYAYSTLTRPESEQVKFALLTDFEEFRFFDCTFPVKDKSVINNYITSVDWHYSHYVDHFKDLWDLFEKENVRNGSLESLFINEKKIKKNRISPDKAFLHDLDNTDKGWRKLLADDIFRNNKNLQPEFITKSIQYILDRLIFLKVLADRDIEKDHILKIYKEYNENENKHLISLFERFHNIFTDLDRLYNGNIFEKNSQIESLKVSNSTLNNIITQFIPDNSRYNFNILPVEMLGAVYEQFLGKVVVINDKNEVKIEQKPEVRKAGGVYYTPQYIVDYIVKNTIGEKLKICKSIEELLKIKICDPACGSGSFLLGAYDYLIKWAIEYFHNKLQPDFNISKADLQYIYIDENNNIKLTAKLKREILQSCIYGVDIDIQAVEVTQISLSLKALENINKQELNAEYKLFNQKILPDMTRNIRNGNSLIGFDFEKQFPNYNGKNLHPFDWEDAYLFKFDCIIGNPPYVRQETLNIQKDYFQNKYSVYHGVADLYSYFIEKGINLLKEKGLFGFIVANKWMRTNYGEPLRKWLKFQNIKQVIDFGDLPVFQQATTYPCILICERSEVDSDINITTVDTLKFHNLEQYVIQHQSKYTQEALNDSGWYFTSNTEEQLLIKISNAGIPLNEYVNKKVFYGIKTGLNPAFVIDKITTDRLIQEDIRSLEIIKPLLIGSDIKRYQYPKGDSSLILFSKGFTNSNSNNPTDAWQWLKNNYSAIAKYLNPYENKAINRCDKGDYWWELRTCDYYSEFEKPKIIYPNILKQPEFTFDTENWYTNQKCFIIPLDDKYLLGILNSKLTHYLFEKRLPKLRGGYYEPNYVIFKNFPIHKIDTSNQNEVKIKNEIIENVELLLKYNKKLVSLVDKNEILEMQQRINNLERENNKLVYKIYGINNQSEIDIIEQITSKK